MKTTPKISFLGVILFLVLPMVLYCGEVNSPQYKTFPTQGKWNVKLSFARYKMETPSNFVFMISSWQEELEQTNENDKYVYGREKREQFRGEFGYCFNQYFEIGASIGFQIVAYTEEKYLGQMYDTIDNVWYPNMIAYKKTSIAPVFGCHVNFHILPIFVKANPCHWDIYLTARYGACVLMPKMREGIFVNIKPEKAHKKLYPLYRQEYGIGAGIAYYFKHKVGIHYEFMLGQFSYFKQVESIHCSRLGVSYKF